VKVKKGTSSTDGDEGDFRALRRGREVSIDGRVCGVSESKSRPKGVEGGEYEIFLSSSSSSNEYEGEYMNDFDDGMSSGSATNLTIFRPH